MVDQKEGETELGVKVHYDDMVSLFIIWIFIIADLQLHQKPSHIYVHELTPWDKCGSLHMKEILYEVFRLRILKVIKNKFFVYFLY
jgi:hypothetical protein